MRSFNSLKFLFLILLVTSCTSQSIITDSRIRLEPSVTAEEVRVYTDGEPVPNSAIELGEIRVTDKTFSATVPYDTTVVRMQRAAAAEGANAVMVLEHTTPHWLNNNMNHGFYGKMLLTKDTIILANSPNPFSEQYAAYQDKLERKRMPPHTIHVGAGYSHIASGIEVDGIEAYGLKRGIGLEVAYSYLLPKTWMGFGVNYTGHFADALIKEMVNVKFFVHNITPTIDFYSLYEKHALKTSIGLGYLQAQFIGPLQLETNAKPLKETFDGLSSYISIEYEYRIDKYTGFFLRLHEMNWLGEYDEARERWESIANFGASIGFNLHL